MRCSDTPAWCISFRLRHNKNTMLSSTATIFSGGCASSACGPTNCEENCGSQNGEPRPEMPLRYSGIFFVLASQWAYWCCAFSTEIPSSLATASSALPAPFTVASNTCMELSPSSQTTLRNRFSCAGFSTVVVFVGSMTHCIKAPVPILI